MKAWQAAAVSVVVLLSACSEVADLPTSPSSEQSPLQPADGASRALSTNLEDPPDDVPPEYQHYTWIDVSVDVGWMNPTTAYGQALVRYGGNNATADVTLTVRNAQGTTIGQNHGTAQASYVFPGNHVLYASTNVYVSQSCGLIAQATAVGSVFDSFFAANQSTPIWGKKTESGSNSSVQPQCPPPPATSPTGSGDGTTTGTTGSSTPPTYEPGPFLPNGHWECVIYYMGTDYEQDFCTWYADYTRLPGTSPSLALIAADAPARTLAAAALPSVFIIVSDQVPADAMAVIERHRQGPFRNVLLVPSSTIRPAVLVAALRALADSRIRDGETPRKDLRLTLRGGILDQQIPAAAREYAARFTSLIANAKRADAGAYGTRQILELLLDDRN